MSKLSFDASTVKPQQALDPIPSDWYAAAIRKSDTVPTKDTKGQRLSLEFEVIDGEFKGRKVFEGINVKNANPVAQQIAAEQLSAICHATGVIKISDTVQLHDKPLMIKVGLEAARTDPKTNETYEARNVIKGYKPAEGGGGVAAAAAGGVAAGGKSPAWLKKPAAAPAAPDPEPTPEPAAAEPDTRLFWVGAEPGKDAIEMDGEALKQALLDGMPVDTPVMLQDETEFKTAADYGIGEVAEKAPAAPVVPAKKAPPVAAPKAAPAAAPAAPAAKATPPWLKGKK